MGMAGTEIVPQFIKGTTETSLYWLLDTSVREKPLLCRIECDFTSCRWMCNEDTM